jgi:hypothetical protein
MGDAQMCPGRNNMCLGRDKMCLGFMRHILIGQLGRHEKENAAVLFVLPAFKIHAWFNVHV